MVGSVVDLTESDGMAIPDTNTDSVISINPPPTTMPANDVKPRAKKAKISSAGSRRSQEEKAEPKEEDASFSRQGLQVQRKETKLIISLVCYRRRWSTSSLARRKSNTISTGLYCAQHRQYSKRTSATWKPSTRSTICISHNTTHKLSKCL